MEDESVDEEYFSDRWERVTEDEFLEFERIENNRSKRPDLHAFLLLDELFPGDCDIVCHAEHDQIWLEIDDDQAATMTDAQLIELARCGVMYSDGLSMFV